MAKTLLWVFVVGNVINLTLLYLNDIERDPIEPYPLWVAIAIIAICEAIEKVKLNTEKESGNNG